MTDPAVAEACDHLVSLVGRMLDPGTAPDARKDAFNRLEEFKASSGLVVPCALTLARGNERGPFVR